MNNSVLVTIPPSLCKNGTQNTCDVGNGIFIEGQIIKDPRGLEGVLLNDLEQEAEYTPIYEKHPVPVIIDGSVIPGSSTDPSSGTSGGLIHEVTEIWSAFWAKVAAYGATIVGVILLIVAVVLYCKMRNTTSPDSHSSNIMIQPYPFMTSIL